MDITDIRERRIMITFHNRAAFHCVISEIYFVDGDSISISVQSVMEAGEATVPALTIVAGAHGCSHAPDPYHDSSSYRVARRRPGNGDSMQDGIKPNESLGIVFDLQAGITLADIVSALSRGILNISLKLLGVPPGSAAILINDSTPGLGRR